MNKQEFFARLRKGLSGLPQDEIEERITFYGEMIEDGIEEGLSEEEAVAAVGSVDEIVKQTVAEIPLSKIAKERIKPKRRLKAWEIVLLVIGSPIWLSLGIAALSVILVLYVSLWAIMVSLWGVFAELVVLSVACVPISILLLANGGVASGLMTLSAGIVCAGLAIFMFFGCREATKGILAFTKEITVWIKNCFIKREEE